MTSPSAQAPHKRSEIVNGPEGAQPHAPGCLEANRVGHADQRRIDFELEQCCAGGGAAVKRRPTVKEDDRKAPRCRNLRHKGAGDAGADNDHICACSGG